MWDVTVYQGNGIIFGMKLNSRPLRLKKVLQPLLKS